MIFKKYQLSKKRFAMVREKPICNCHEFLKICCKVSKKKHPSFQEISWIVISFYGEK